MDLQQWARALHARGWTVITGGIEWPPATTEAAEPWSRGVVWVTATFAVLVGPDGRRPSSVPDHRRALAMALAAGPPASSSAVDVVDHAEDVDEPALRTRLPSTASVGRSRTAQDRLQRISTRSHLHAAPGTLVSASEIALVFGFAEGLARELRPASCRKVGRSLMAPFGDWLKALEPLLGASAPDQVDEQQPNQAPAPVPHRDRRRPRTLRSIGGPR